MENNVFKLHPNLYLASSDDFFEGKTLLRKAEHEREVGEELMTEHPGRPSSRVNSFPLEQNSSCEGTEASTSIDYAGDQNVTTNGT